MMHRSDILEDAREKYPPAGSKVDGLLVSRGIVPNMESIEASIEDYEILDGIREVGVGHFEPYCGLESVFYDIRDIRRAEELAKRIEISRRITPLIVVEDEDGPYLLEGLHRYAALRSLGKKSFPAVVVVDMDGRFIHDQDKP